MDIEIFPSPHLKGSIQAPPSKSYTHRAIIMSGLANGLSIISKPLIGTDTIASIEAMRALGASIREDNEKLIIEGTTKLHVPKNSIDVANSGTTIRFLTALAAHVPGLVRLTGDESIQRRPMGPLLDAMKQLGVKCWSESADGTPPLLVQAGILKGGQTSIRGDISSQFISALLISAPLAESDVIIQLTTPLKSAPYLDITHRMLQKFNIKFSYDPQKRVYHIPGRQTYHPVEFLQGEITVSNLDMEDPQGDKQLIPLLKTIGAKVKIDIQNKNVTIRKNQLTPFKVDCKDIPDIVPILAVLASFIPGKSKIFNAAHIRIKESDRLHTITTELRKMNVDIKELPDGLIINGSVEHQCAELETYNDHRIAMALIIAALPLKENTLIRNIDSIRVSYPSFLKDLKSLGGRFRVID
ncbi:MAG: 3-phosphoshikimate 1-carboxyvinyltransferase [Candidatus Helarchaeota archaeon]